MKRRYYEGHENQYRRLREQGHVTWDRGAFDDFGFRHFLLDALESTSLPARASTLEIGCGTGPGCCFLARRGFVVHGIDVSATAIQMAVEQAQTRGLAIDYSVGDVCRTSLGEKVYDVIVDGHCMHCLVHDADRQVALSSVHRALKPGGWYLLESMSRTPSMRLPDDGRIDGDGILWSSVNSPSEYEDCVFQDGHWWVPNRRLLDVSVIAGDLERAGFCIRWQRSVAQEDGFPILFQVRAQRL